ncbi:MAG: glycine zipper 2TM domain-containing protein [Rhodobacteraceae bacterium]|nr:glycine zipper 2TM domain-containing protein [Paracoccaceae bacterium]
MKKTILMTIIALGSAACVPATDQATLGGAATGALLGAAVSDSDDRVEGAIIGGAVGAVAGSLIGRANTQGDCVYEDSLGRRYVAPC